MLFAFVVLMVLFVVPHMDKLLTIRELAERLNISEGTAYHWLSEGRLKCVRFSRRCVRFREGDVQQLLDDLTQNKRTRDDIDEVARSKRKSDSSNSSTRPLSRRHS